MKDIILQVLEVLQLALDNNYSYEPLFACETCAYAAAGGHRQVLQLLRAIGCDWSTSTCSEAAMGGYLEVLKWARANGEELTGKPFGQESCADRKTVVWKLLEMHCGAELQSFLEAGGTAEAATADLNELESS